MFLLQYFFAIGFLLLNFGVCNVEVISAVKSVSISSSVVKIENKVVYLNKGGETVDKIIYAFNESLIEKLSYFAINSVHYSGFIASELDDSTFFKLENIKGLKFVSVTLPRAIATGEKCELEFMEVYIDSLKPFPKKIIQLQKNGVIFETSAYFLSPYTVKKQVFEISLKNCQLVKLKSEIEFSQKRNSLIAEITGSVAPYSDKPVSFHLMTDFSLIILSSVTREIYFSEYGKIHFVDSYVVENRAAELKGEYSRLYDQVLHKEAHVSFEFTMYLPPKAKDIRYVDLVGNISTSSVHDMGDRMVLNVQPRFPIYGGWNTEFTVKYTVLAENYLTHSTEDATVREFSGTLLGPFQGLYPVEKLTIRFILPENAKSISFSLPKWVTYKSTIGKKFYYLDMFGRPTYQVEAKNLVKLHDELFTISYAHETVMLLMKPLLASAIFACIFLAISLTNRLSIFGEKKTKSEKEVFLERFQLTLDKINEVHTQLREKQDVVLRCIKEKDVATLKELKERQRREYEAIKAEIAVMNQKLVDLLPSFSLLTKSIIPKLELLFVNLAKQVEISCAAAENGDKKHGQEVTALKSKFEKEFKELGQVVSSI